MSSPNSPGDRPSPARQSGPAAHDAVRESTALPPAKREEGSSEDNSDVGTFVLSHFGSALRDLRDGTSTGRVRVVWFGDSHTAADFLTGEVRRGLQSRFGDGGPGFVPIGISTGRHDRLRVKTTGTWTREPNSLAAFEFQLDGVLGLQGLRARVHAPATFSVTAQGETGALLEAELWFRGGQHAAVWRLNGISDPEESASTTPLTLSKRLSVLRLRTQGHGVHGVLRLGEAEVFGVVLEHSGAGLVLDTIGLNGAQLRTLLRSDAAAWEEALSRREPDLVVLAFGTNEAGHRFRMSRYPAFYSKVLQRVRRAAPEASCLLVGPTDRASPEAETERRTAAMDALQREVAEREGCGYISLIDLMGGEGSYERFSHHKPAWAGADGVHLTRQGYLKLGSTLTEELLQLSGLERQ